MNSLFLIVLYIFATLLPLAMSWITGGPPRPVRDELATGLGILAFTIILAEFVLSGRFKAISNGIGMDVTMRFHQVMARTALAFALIHPFLYTGAPTGGARPWDPTRQLTITTDFTVLSTGIAAFLLLPALVLLAIGRTRFDYRYETWRAMHGIGALVIALSLLHHAVYAGRYAAHPWVMWLWIGLTAIAVGSLVYVYLVAPLRDLARPWRVSAVTRLSARQWEVRVTPERHDGLRYKAGQFAWLNIGHSPFSLNENPFSISSAPSAGGEVSFVIKELGDFTSTLGRIAPGTRAYLDAPFGSLTVDGRDEPGIVLIAGGVGIAPLIGILRELRATDDPRKVALIYGNRLEEQIIHRDELQGVDATYVLTEPPPGWTGETGLIDAACLDRALSPAQVRDWLFVLCGPSAMLEGAEAYLIARGTPAGRILSERFDYD